MKGACVILSIIILVAIMAVSIMVKFATDITVEERKRELPDSGVPLLAQTITVNAMNENVSTTIAERFPYVAAIASNSSSTWSFACFASVILVKWLVTSAHCRKKGTNHVTHRVLLLNDFTQNSGRSYPILFWRIHEKFNASSPFYDIAVAKFNNENQLAFKFSTFDDKQVTVLDTCIWKTVSSMDRKLYLINDFDEFHLEFASPGKCFASFGILVNESQFCVDMSRYEDCFIYEFGPIYSGDKLVGILSMQPKDCNVKYSIFTNVSYFSSWILKVTHTGSL